ncbi:hypothetical protein FOL47_000030 [Perkinsus chesapeaki]|uniref:Uncharacterized protein n=1 Tax=Perkinsus chesapeaki TaxID=330153 RepID=A0A7J6N5V3_PERCH|nr:hypothetical protein FOL47_000030 [Perkinsus chesapeaki]
MLLVFKLLSAFGTAAVMCRSFSIEADDALDVDDTDLSSLLAHRAHLPRAGDDEISRLVAEYSDVGTEEELMEIVRKVDARAEMAMMYKGRRRRGEPPGVLACEMLGVYSDADNYDCHMRRYREIQATFDPEQTVHEEASQMRVKADTLKTEWGRAETALDKLMEYTYGKGGSKSNPSTKDGLTHKFGLASAALYELHAATATAADEIWAEFDKIHFGYSADMDDLKTGAVHAFNSLITGIQDVIRGQADDQMKNQVTLNEDANAKLSNCTKGINRNQVEIERAAKGVENQKDRLEATAEKSLDDAEDTLTNIADELAEVPVKDMEERDKASDEVRHQMEKDEDQTEAEMEKLVAGYEEKADKKMDQFEEGTTKQIENQGADWKAEEENRRKGLEAKVEKERQELDKAQGTLQSAIGDAEEKASHEGHEFEKKHAGRWAEFEQLAADIGLSSEEFEKMVEQFGLETETGTHELEEEAKRNQAGLKNELSDKISATGGGIAGILGSLFSALAGAEQDIYGTSEGAKHDVLKSIRKTLEESGLENTKIGQVLGNFIDGVLKGEKGLASDLLMKLQGVDIEAHEVGDSLQGGVMHLLDNLGHNEARANLQAHGIKTDVENSLHNGVNGLDGKLTGLNHAVLTAEEETTGQMNKGLHSILRELGDVGDAADGLFQGLTGLSHDEHQLKGDALTGNRRISVNERRLAQRLAQTVMGLGAQLMQFVTGSEGSLAASMRNEDMKAGKEFGVVAGEYGLGIKDYEGTGKEGYTELKSRLGNDAIRAKGLEGDLGLTEEQLAKLQRGEQVNLDDENKAYENYLSQNTAKTGAELEGIRARLVGSEGQIERELRDEMDSAAQRSEQEARKREAEAGRTISAAERKLQSERSDDAGTERKMEEDADRFNRDKDGTEKDLDDVMKDISGEDTKFDADHKDLMDKFSEVQGKEQEDLNKLTATFEGRVNALPKTVASRMKELQKEFYASHTAIDKRIAELRHQAANAETEEEREAARKNLEALEKMREFADKIKAADDAMKAKILRGEEIDEEELLAVQDGMKAVVGNLENIEGDFNGNGDTLNLEYGDVERRLGSLYSGMGASVTEGVSVLDRERREALTGTQFDIQTSELNNKHRLDGLGADTNGAKHISILENQEFLALEHAQKNNITKVQSELRDMKQGITTRISNVMTELAKSQSRIHRSVNEDEADIAFRLGLVRQAVGQFLAIWKDYANSMHKKLNKFHQTDLEILELMVQASRKAQDDTTRKVEKAAAKVSSYDRQLDEGYKEAREFAEFTDSQVSKLKEEEKEAQERSKSVMEESTKDLEQMIDTQEKLNEDQMHAATQAFQDFRANLEKNAAEVLESAGIEAAGNAAAF